MKRMGEENMRTIFYEELKRTCNEMNAENDPEKEKMILKVLERVKKYHDVSRREGLLEMEELCEDLDESDKLDRFWKLLITLIVDGTDTEYLEEIAMNYCMANPLPSYEGYIYLMYLKAAVMIKCGAVHGVFDAYLKSMMPKKIHEKYLR